MVKEKVFIEWINKVKGLGELKKQTVVMDNLKRHAVGVRQTFSKLDKGIQKTQTAYTGVNKAGKRVVKIMETTQDVSKKLQKEQDTRDERIRKNIKRADEQQQKRSLSAQKAISKGLAKQAESTRNVNDVNKGFFKTIGLGTEEYKRAQTSYNGFTKAQRRQVGMSSRAALGIRNATHGMRGFKMEMLGVMFFGMSMMRVLGGLLRTSLEWTGVTEIMTTALGLLFLPVALMLLDWALMFLQYIGEMSEEKKKWIGMIVLAGIALGTLLMVFGTLMLGIGSVILAIKLLTGWIGLAVIAAGGFLIFKKIKSWLNDTEHATDELQGKLTGFGISGEAFDIMKNKVIKWYDVLREKFSGIRTKIGTWIAETIPVVISGGADLLMGLVNGIKNNAGKIGTAIGTVIDKIFSWLDENISQIMKAGLEILTSIIDGITNNLDKLEKVVEEIAGKITDFIIEHIDEFVEIGIKIGSAIAKGIGKSTMSWFDKIDDWIEEKTGFQTRLKGDYSVTSPETKYTDELGQGMSIGPEYTPYLAPITPSETRPSSQSQTINIYPSYDVTLNEEHMVKGWINQSNKSMVEEVRRGIKV